MRIIQDKIINLHKGISPMEASYRHLPINHFHGGLQKVKGKVDGFTELIRETMVN
jgi:hypothetical protein